MLVPSIVASTMHKPAIFLHAKHLMQLPHLLASSLPLKQAAMCAGRMPELSLRSMVGFFSELVTINCAAMCDNNKKICSWQAPTRLKFF